MAAVSRGHPIWTPPPTNRIKKMVDRWDISDHILLINPCLETLPVGTKSHESFHKDTYVLGDVIVVLHYNSCSKWRPPISLYILHRLAMLC
jgi:hypothetical protein